MHGCYIWFEYRSASDVADQTNVLVNGQRLELLVLVRDLRQRIARENPDDEEAQLGLARSEKNLEEARLAASATRHARRAVRKHLVVVDDPLPKPRPHHTPHKPHERI